MRKAGTGGRWSPGILGYEHADRLLGIHLNLAIADPRELVTNADLTEQEQADLGHMSTFQQNGTGYSGLQSTRPQTLGYGLSDSPVGQLTWVVEKFHAWTDNDGTVESAISRDDLLDNVMAYWLTNTAASSARLYWESFAWAFANFTPTVVPVAYSVLPAETLRLSKRWALTRYPDLRYYRRVERGGHFAAFEQPALFVDEVRAGFRAIFADASGDVPGS